jgi:hypothetical protein
MSGQNEVLPKNLEVGVWYGDQMYYPKYHSKHTASNSNVRTVWYEVHQGTLF